MVPHYRGTSWPFGGSLPAVPSAMTLCIFRHSSPDGAGVGPARVIASGDLPVRGCPGDHPHGARPCGSGVVALYSGVRQRPQVSHSGGTKSAHGRGRRR